MRSGKSLPYLFLSLAVIGSLLLFAENAMASGPLERTLYTFSGKSHGGGPFEMDGLIADHLGNLYGTARGGGQGGGGVVFELTPPSVAGGRWTESVLYSFPIGGDGDFRRIRFVLRGCIANEEKPSVDINGLTLPRAPHVTTPLFVDQRCIRRSHSSDR